jgi:signal transduction histidine kinase
MTASTAELAAGFSRTRSAARAKRAPEHAVKFTLIAVVTAYGLLFLPTGIRLEYGDVWVAALLSAALLGLTLFWSTFPRLATLAIPVGYIVLAAFLREAAGGAASGFGGLFLLPVLWLAVTAGRRELAAILVAMVAAQAIPLALGGPHYPASGWRGALVLTTVAAVTGLMVQRLSADARRRTTLLQEQTDWLTRASAQLAAQNERLLELDRLKDEFVATASHELRTPLTSLSGYLEMSLDPAEGPLSPTRESHLRIVQRNANRLTALVDQLLFLARADSHPLELDRHPVDLEGILNEAVETARPAASAKNISLVVTGDPLPDVPADRPQLLRVVDNLVANAVKFTPDGGTVRLAARKEGDSAALEVTDTGLGIPRAEQSELFNRFFRGTNAIEKAIPGSGLGLAISQVIAEAHGGTIQLDSTPGVGSTFRLVLPVA